MWRASLKIAACLLLGVVTSVAVAWGCVISSTFGAWRVVYEQPDVPWAVLLLKREGLTGGGLCIEAPATRFGVRDLSVWYAADPRRRDSTWTLVGAIEGMWTEAHWSLAGWPCLALTSHAEQFHAPLPPMNRTTPTNPRDSLFVPARAFLGCPATDLGLPLRVEWPGMVCNSLVYASILVLLGPARGIARRWRYLRRGQCLSCGYSLAGNTSGVCPECGTSAKPCLTTRSG